MRSEFVKLKNYIQVIQIIKITPLMIIIIRLCLDILRNSNFFYFSIRISSWMNIFLSIDLSKYRLIFLLIVRTVSFFIMYYSRFYIERYNKKKFLILTIIFFFSIVILSIRNGYCSTIIGWDGLGISSICLIIIYQNKKTSRNSLLTITFNRLGDVFLILGLIKASSIMCNFNFSINRRMGISRIIFLVLASITKRAQFPLSTWLPAAISAPTPISAIVHSSTLVTAGIYLIVKVSSVITINNLIWIIIITSSISIIGAGIFSIYEKDLKKIIAFSTIRHIRIIIFILSIRFKNLALIHILTHAIFKTSVFIRAGRKFLSKWNDQNLNFIKIENNRTNNYFKIRALILTSIPFTVSFYTKDILIEINIFKEKRNIIYSLYLWIITILTILYSKIILSSLVEKNGIEKSISIKKGLNIIFINISFLIITTRKACFFLLKSLITPIIRKIEAFRTIIFIFLASSLKSLKRKKVIFLRTRIILKTEFTINKIKLIIEGYTIIYILDFFLINKRIWSIKYNINDKYNNKYNNSILFLIIASIIIMVT